MKSSFRGELCIRDGKGGKDRVTVLPAVVRKPMSDHLDEVRRQHDHDLTAGRGSVALLNSLASKYPRAPWEWGGVRPQRSGVRAGYAASGCVSAGLSRPA
jgi:hypothetical protein